MGQAVAVPAKTKDTYSARRRFDRRILLLFAVLAGLAIGILASLNLFTEGVTTYELASSTLGGLIFSFTVVGIPVYRRYGKDSLTPKRRILRRIGMLSILMTAITMSGIALASVYAPDAVVFEKLSPGILLLVGASMAISIFIAYLIICYAALVAAFGIVGILVALQRLLTPRILSQVVGLSGNEKRSLPSRAVKWLFDIPDVLDTKTLSIHPTRPRIHVSLSDLKAPVFWQLAFGFVLGIYISFNPFVSDRSPETFLRIFSLLTTSSALFPFLILPWFLFKRLGAGITGQAKRFTLFNGIRARVFQSYFAVGTIVIMVRLSIQDIAVAFETYVAAFAVFMAVLLISALLSTFVYLNYFENRLAEDVIEGVRETEVQIVV